MKHLFFVLILSVVCHQELLAQQGFINSKNALSISAFGNVPLLTGSFKAENYEKRGDQMKEVKDWLDYGFKLKFVSSVKRKLAVGFLISSYNLQVAPLPMFGVNYKRLDNSAKIDNYGIQMESIGINKFSFMPVLEFYHKNGLAPVGFYHTIGLGYSLAKIQNGSYALSISETSISDENPIGTGGMTKADYYYLDEDWKAIQFIEVMYGMGMKVPISKSIGFEFGVNYNLNFTPKINDEQALLDKYGVFNYSSIYYNLRREAAFSMTAHVGFVFIF